MEDKQKAGQKALLFVYGERGIRSRLRARSGSALTAHRAVIHYRPVRILSDVNKKQGKSPAFHLRRERDSNPRVLSHKLISSQPRYDHFDISPFTRTSVLYHKFFEKAIPFLKKIKFFNRKRPRSACLKFHFAFLPNFPKRIL